MQMFNKSVGAVWIDGCMHTDSRKNTLIEVYSLTSERVLGIFINRLGVFHSLPVKGDHGLDNKTQLYGLELPCC